MRGIPAAAAACALVCACSGARGGAGNGAAGASDAGASASSAPDAGPGAAQHLLTVHFVNAGIVSGTDATTGAPLFTCTNDCAQQIVAGRTVQLTASTADGGSFRGLSGACNGLTCALTMVEDAQVTATFAPGVHSWPVLTIVAQGTGSGTVVFSFTGGGVSSTPAGLSCSPECAVNAPPGAQIHLSALADKGSFTGWSGACSGTNDCTFALNASTTVTAQFDLPPPPPSACGAPFTLPSPRSAQLATSLTCAEGFGDAQGSLFLFAAGGDPSNELAWQGLAVDAQSGLAQPLSAPSQGGSDRFLSSINGFFDLQTEGAALSVQRYVEPGFSPSSGPSIGGAPVPAEIPTIDGFMLAGDFIAGRVGAHQLCAFDTSAGVLWCHALAASGPVYGLGVDDLQRTLVITGGQNGQITAQWFQRGGTPLTSEFTLFASFTPGAHTWFETAPLIGGGLAVRRVDQLAGSTGSYLSSAWLATLLPEIEPVPAWLANHPDTQLARARGETLYALLPLGGPSCAGNVELVTPAGDSCGALPLGSCAADVTAARDGTLIQRVPQSAGACAWRYWPAALR